MTLRLALPVLVTLLLAVPTVAQAAPADLDPSFGTGGEVFTPFADSYSSGASALLQQSDGKIVAVGCGVTGDTPHNEFLLARYLPSGQLDPTFGTGGTVSTSFPGGLGGSSGCAQAAALQPDGKIVAAGRGGSYYGFALARYNTDGSLDQAFGSGGLVVENGNAPDFPKLTGANGVAIQPDGKIVAAGDAWVNPNGVVGFGVARFNADGTPDRSFGAGLASGGTGYVVTLLTPPEGSSGVSTGGGATGIIVDRAGHIDAVGSAVSNWPDSTYGYPARLAVVRYNADGSLDSGFASGGVFKTSAGGPTDQARGYAIAQDAVGRLVVGGWHEPYADQNWGTAEFLVGRLNNNGQFDTSFGSGGLTLGKYCCGAYSGGATKSEARGLALQPDGKIAFAGPADDRTCCGGNDYFGIGRLNANGSLDSEFGQSGTQVGPPYGRANDVYYNARAYALARQSDGKYVVAGGGEVSSGSIRSGFVLARFQGTPPPPGDRDGDGVPDAQDACPTQFGTLPNGCPAAADRDGDGISDSTDQCPDQPGVAPAGCPNPAPPPGDRDGDGLPDSRDRCPTVPAATSDGCPAPVHTFRLRAIGDSVTAGFGFRADGQATTSVEIGRSCLANPATSSCQSPNVVAYPAVYARTHGIKDFQNLAMSGATAGDWLGDGKYDNRMRDVLNPPPDLTLVTLGANPLLFDILTAARRLHRWPCVSVLTDPTTCVEREIANSGVIPDLARVYQRLLSAPSNHVVVLFYPATVPELLRGTAGGLSGLYTNELRYIVASAVAKASSANPSAARRLRLIDAGAFEHHGCHASNPWILSTDTCLHPNARGHQEMAAAIDRAFVPAAAGPRPALSGSTYSAGRLAIAGTAPEAGIVVVRLSSLPQGSAANVHASSRPGGFVAVATREIAKRGPFKVRVVLTRRMATRLRLAAHGGKARLRARLLFIARNGTVTSRANTTTVRVPRNRGKRRHTHH